MKKGTQGNPQITSTKPTAAPKVSSGDVNFDTFVRQAVQAVKPKK